MKYRLAGLVALLAGFWFGVVQMFVFPGSLGSVWMMRFPPIPIPYAGNVFWVVVGLAGLGLLIFGGKFLDED